VRLGVYLLADRGIEDHLGQPFTIAQVHENDPAVIPAALDPAHQYHFFAHIIGPQLVAMMGSSHVA
jgi:hypothetical protein